jgi:hypothetical protein
MLLYTQVPHCCDPSRHFQAIRKRRRYHPPSKYCPRVCKNVAESPPSYKLSGDVNTLSAEVKVRVWGLESLCGGQMGCCDSPQPAHLIEDVDKDQGIITLRRHRGDHTLLRCQQPGEGVWELLGSYVDRYELHEEGVLGC